MTVTNATDELDPPPLERLIGFDTLSRPLESWYAFVSRLIRANLLNDVDIRKQLPADWVRCAFAPHEVQTSDLAVPAPYIDRLPDVALKLRPITWQPFPELSSAARMPAGLSALPGGGLSQLCHARGCDRTVPRA